MTLNGKTVWWIIGCCLAAVISFAVGVRVGQRSMLKGLNVQLDSVQAELAFNRLHDERHWKELLSKGCIAQAVRSLDGIEDEDLGLLAGFVHGRIDKDALEYISNGNPGFIKQLNTFKSKYGNEWSEGKCNG